MNEIWQDYLTFDKNWKDLTSFDKICQDLTRIDKNWQDLTRFDKKQKNLTRFDKIRLGFDRTGLDWQKKYYIREQFFTKQQMTTTTTTKSACKKAVLWRSDAALKIITLEQTKVKIFLGQGAEKLSKVKEWGPKQFLLAANNTHFY